LKLTITKSKNAVCFYVQRTVRIDGRTTTKTVEKLGNLEMVKTRAGGQDPYEWAKAYVEGLNRKQYEEQQSILVSLSPNKIVGKDEQLAFNCGYLFLQKIYYSLRLDKICQSIAEKSQAQYNLNAILSRLVYTRILYPASKRGSLKAAKDFYEQPSFELQDVYRSLSLLAENSDFIQAELYKHSQKLLERRKDMLYYDCTNYYFEIEESDELRKYGKSKEHRPNPIVGMGLFMDHDGIPIAFCIYPGNQNEQPTMKPLEQKILKDFNLGNVVVCTDAGLSSKQNRKYNDLRLGGEERRSFITTQSIKQLPADLKKFALDTGGWHLAGDSRKYNIAELDEDTCLNKIFYKERWIKEDISSNAEAKGKKPLEQRLVVSYSLKYRNYLRSVRNSQVERAKRLIASGNCTRKGRNQEDPRRFIRHSKCTAEGEICEHDVVSLDTEAIANEEKYDGFYAVCTNLQSADISEIIKINRQRWQIEECFRIMKTEFKARPVYLQREDRIKAHFLTCYIALFIFRILQKQLGSQFTCEDIISTLKKMDLTKTSDGAGFIPSYTRTDLTDCLHQHAGFRTDYQIMTGRQMRSVIAQSRKVLKSIK
jgi:transposase